MSGPARPENVRMSDHQEAESVTLEWNAPDCPHSGYITHYVLEHCRLDHGCGRLLLLDTVAAEAILKWGGARFSVSLCGGVC